MARREGKTQAPKAPTTPPPPKPREKDRKTSARAARLAARRERLFREFGIVIQEPKYKDDLWKVRAHNTLLNEARSKRSALKHAHQHIRNVQQRGQ